jgi:hypothetical protein
MDRTQHMTAIIVGVLEETRDATLEEAAALCEVNQQPNLAAALRKRKSKHEPGREAAPDPESAR